MSSWNNHPMRTTYSRSPLQLWHSGFCAANAGYSEVQGVIDDANRDWNDYGIDGDGPLSETSTDYTIEVPEVQISITEAQLDQLQAWIDPLSNDDNHGINLYVNTLEVVNRVVQL